MAKHSAKSMEKLLREIEETKNWDLLSKLMAQGPSVQLSAAECEKMAQLLFEHGNSLNQPKANVESQESREAAFIAAVRLDPQLSHAWVALGEERLQRAQKGEDVTLWQQAEDAFSRAHAAAKARQEDLTAYAYWRWGVCCFFLFRESQEALELRSAADKFQIAHALGLDNAQFYFDYASALAEMGTLMGRWEMLGEAAGFFERCLAKEPTHPSAWLRIACTYTVLRMVSSESSLFEKADQAFVAAARLDQSNEVLWLKWGELFLHEAKVLRDGEIMRVAIEKFERTALLTQEKPALLMAWADALMHLGTWEENFEWLKEAQAKLIRAVVLVPDDLDALFLLGQADMHLARYFTDIHYVKQALDHFQICVQQQKHVAPFWHALACAHSYLGEITEEKREYEKASKAFAQAVRAGGRTQPACWYDWGVASLKLAELTHDASTVAGAIEKFEEMLRCAAQKGMNPLPEWLYSYGLGLDLLGDLRGAPVYFERAITVLSKLLDQHPQHLPARHRIALAYYHLAEALGDFELLEQAVNSLEQLVQEDPENDDIFISLGVTLTTMAQVLSDSIHCERGRDVFERAEVCFSQARALGNVESYYYLACVCALQEQYTEALYHLERGKTLRTLPPLEVLEHDDWLNGLRDLPEFQAFLAEYARSEEERTKKT